MSRLLVRDPRDIPDNLVSSVLDFCRRAQRPSTPVEVRLALARVPEERERELLMAASREPPATPLSPQAFVDWIEGMPPEQAAALEESGAYLALAREAAAEALEMQLRREEPAEKKVVAPARRRRRTKEAPTTLLVRRRPRPTEAEPSPEGEIPPTEEETAAGPTPRAARPGRRPATPQFGRFVSGAPAKRPIAELEGAEGAEILRELVAETHGNLKALGDRLNASWSGDHGGIGPERIESLLRRHGLEEERRKVERERLRSLLRRQRGFERPVARAWRISPHDLRRLIEAYGLAEEVKEIRERARAEILAETRLGPRLALLFRQHDRLRALGVQRTVHQEVYLALRDLVDDFPLEEGTEAPEVLLERIRREEGFDRGLWRWATDHFNLMGMAAHRLGLPLPPSRPRRHPEPRGFRSDRARPPRRDRR